VAVAKLIVPAVLTRRVVIGSAPRSMPESGSSTSTGPGRAAASLNRSIGGIRPIDWCGRSWL